MFEVVRKEFERMRYALTKSKPQECANCGASSNLELHHVVPIALGGTNRLTNLVMLCEPCHGKTHGEGWRGNFKMAQAAGIARAKAEGRYKGRPVDEDLHGRVRELLSSGLGVRPTARKVGCSTTTVIKIRDALRETAHLLESPKNAEWLKGSIAQLRTGGAKQRELVV